MNYCPNCGNQLQTGSTVCPHCNQDLSATGAQPPPQVPPQGPQYGPPGAPGPPPYGVQYGAPPPVGPRTSGLAIASLVLGILAICYGFTGIPGFILGLVAISQI
ncbi:MAG: zinc ribbon domain-containing protein, partial [bacterium]